MLERASAAAQVVLRAKSSRRVVGAVDAAVPCLAASVADVPKGEGALSVTLALVVEVAACMCRRWCWYGARRLPAVAARSRSRLHIS